MDDTLNISENVKKAILDIFNEFTNVSIDYCLLSGWDYLPDYVPSDLDIIVSPDSLPKLEAVLKNHPSGQLIQIFQHEISCYYFIMAFQEGNTLYFVPFDVSTDYRRDGVMFFTGEELLRGKQYLNNLWVIGPEAEFGYLIAKKIAKGSLPVNRQQRLQELYTTIGAEKADPLAKHLLGEEEGSLFIKEMLADNWTTITQRLPTLKQVLHQQVSKRKPLNYVVDYLKDIGRMWKRWQKPTGLCIAILGPDGSGKSTLINSIESDMERGFRRVKYYHLRPDLFKKRSEHTDQSVADPHGKASYPTWKAVLKMFYYMVDYQLGYLVDVRLRLVKSTLVIFDRYYDDMIIDPYRFQFPPNIKLMKWLEPFIPKPDLTLLIDVPEDIILSRKQEVTYEELKRQRQAYLDRAASRKNIVVIDGSQSIEDVSASAKAVLLKYLQDRYSQSHQMGTSNLSSTTYSTSKMD